LQDEIAEIWQKNKTTVVWITNDPDEALLVADRVVPLLPGREGATLGKEWIVPLPRPRDRRELLADPVFKQLKADLVNTLLGAKRGSAARVSRQLPVPDLLPEDLSIRRNFPFFGKPEPRRRSRLVKEELQIESS
jgi:nitrate/nitrite transport system ATP-binding protein